MGLLSIFNINNLKAVFRTLHQNGFRTMYIRSMITIRESYTYPKWYKKTKVTPDSLIKQKAQQTDFELYPKISIIVPTYNTPIDFLHEMIQSVINQSYSNWELCIADASCQNAEIRSILNEYAKNDERIIVSFLNENKGISGNTNEALNLATGDFIALFDHDDLLEPDCLYEVVSTINKHPDAEILYTDEDKVNGTATTHDYPTFKPALNPLLLQSCNYITHFFVFRKDIYKKTGAFSSAHDGSQDYNYIIRTITNARHIYNIPKILYHWRVHSGSVAGDPAQKQYCYDAARRSIQEHLDQQGILASVSIDEGLIGCYHTTYLKKQSTSDIALISTSQCTVSDFIAQVNAASTPYVFISSIRGLQLTDDILCRIESYLDLDMIGAACTKLTRKHRILSLGDTFRNGHMQGCYHNVYIEDTGYCGRTRIDQCVPICSSQAFACKTDLLKDYLSSIDTHPITCIDEIIVGFSLFLFDLKLYIAAIANIEIRTDQKYHCRLSSDFIQANTDRLQTASMLYAVPPYYKY